MADEREPADVLVIFGITGDLARVMTLRSLYRLEQRGLLDFPIVGVAFDDWTLEQLVEHARDAIVAAGEELDEAVFARFAARLSYLPGDFADAGTYALVAKAIEGARLPVFYLEVPPALFGTVVRGHFYDPVGALRDVVQNHLLQVLSLVALEPPTGRGVDVISNRKRDVLVAMAEADPSHYVCGQYAGYLDVDGVAPDSQTETYCALRLEIDNWRWSGIPFFIRAGKSLPVTVTEVRVVFNTTPWLGFVPRDAPRPEPNQLVLRIGPRPGARLRMQAKDAEKPALRSVQLDMEFAEFGGEGPTVYEVLLHAGLQGDSSHFARQDAVEETWRVVQPLLDSPPSVEVYEPGSWGPTSADELVRDHGGWRNPWLP